MLVQRNDYFLGQRDGTDGLALREFFVMGKKNTPLKSFYRHSLPPLYLIFSTPQKNCLLLLYLMIRSPPGNKL
jgi:hypothetical protein